MSSLRDESSSGLGSLLDGSSDIIEEVTHNEDDHGDMDDDSFNSQDTSSLFEQDSWVPVLPENVLVQSPP